MAAIMIKQIPTSMESKLRAGTALATPLVAAAYAAGIVYMWGEAAFRLAFTNSTSFNAAWVLWNGRVGDIAAMWLTDRKSVV